MIFRKYIYLSCILWVESYLLHILELTNPEKKHKIAEIVTVCIIANSSRTSSLNLVLFMIFVDYTMDTYAYGYNNCNCYIRVSHGCIQCPSIRKLPYERVHILYIYFLEIFMLFQVKTFHEQVNSVHQFTSILNQSAGKRHARCETCERGAISNEERHDLVAMRNEGMRVRKLYFSKFW